MQKQGGSGEVQGGSGEAPTHAGFTAVLLQLSFANWIINYPTVSPFGPNWHIGETGEQGRGQGGSGGGVGGGGRQIGLGLIGLDVMYETE